MDLGQVAQKSEVQVLSLTGSIVKNMKQKQPWAKAVKVEAAACLGTGFAVLAVGHGFHSTVWGWL